MKTYLTTFFSIAIVAFALASNPAEYKGTVKGQVLDAATGSPLEYATISAYQFADSSLVTGAVTEPDGTFTIELKNGKYYLVIDYISFQRLSTPPFELKPGSQSVDLGKIEMLPDAQTLAEVEVRAEKSRMQMSLDKRVFNVGKDLANLGGSATDVLDNVPSVTVDAEGAVSLRGSGGVRILIDGRPSGLLGGSDNSGLRQIPANLIDRIEVITNPSARYEAEGMAGIINIILKKEKRNGLNGAVDLTAGYPDNYGLAVNGNYRLNKWNFFANYGLSYRDSPGSGNLYQEVYDRNGIGPDTVFIQQQTRDRSRGGWGHTLRGGLDYAISESASLTGSVTYRTEDGNNTSELTYRDYLFNLDTPTGITTRVDDEREIEDNLEYTVAFRKDFPGKDHRLTIDARYQDNAEVEESVIREAYFTPEFIETGLPGLQQNAYNREKRIQTVLQSDYVRPIGEEGKFEAGLRAGIRDIETNFSVSELENGVLVPVEAFTNDFVFNESVYAAYSSIGNNFGPVSLQAGLRAEYTDMTTELLQTQEVNPRDYLSLFPSVFLGYEMAGQNSVQLSYSRRINRPNFWSLNPFFSFSDARNIYSGNPNLDPEFTHSVETNYLKYWDSASLTAGVFYRHTDGVVQRIRRIDESGVTFTQPENLATEDAYGIDITYSYSPFKWWDLDGNFNFFRSLISGNANGRDLSADAVTMFTRLTSRVTLWKELETQLRANYRAPRVTPQGRTKSLYVIDLSMSKDVLEKKGTLTLSVRDLLNSRKWRTVFEDEGFYSDGEFQWRARQVLLTFNYRINQQKNRRGGGREGGYDGGGGGEF
ncbi:outer membrane beta-barrel family protein [Phaeodactylibacter luteus]|uniref:TonB-dependent receptor n=1 Tax=Phaeodactylibacter luteus TaxID=1564516 RepID=A0A5C6RNJ3_9BACT|nr:outer membrane beta-barrel family protein [Phaeodactylibacter luteus]TXB63544.1 TonB-dependent receptor [Phaeodactylibacter luteus]